MIFLPVGITATKPLMLTHLAGISYLDLSRRLLNHVSPAALWHNRIPWDLSVQNIRFWCYLDLVYPELDFGSLTEHQIGRLYVECFNSSLGVTTELEPFRNKAAELRWATEHQGYVHASSRSIRLHWSQHLEFLGLNSEDIDNQVALNVSHTEILRQLEADGLLINQQSISGSIYLDLTSIGMPLRTLVSKGGEINYLLPILRDLHNRFNRGERVVLFYDDSVEQDYVYLDRLLTRRGLKVTRKKFFRVPVDGMVHSSKGGGWEESTFAFIREKYFSKVDVEIARFAIKRTLLYSLGQKGQRSVSDANITESLECADQTLASLTHIKPPEPAYRTSLFGRFVSKNGLVNVHGLFTHLENKRTPLEDKASIVALLQ